MEINKQKLKILLVGTFGIYFMYFLGGIIQQYIMKVPYTNINTNQSQYFKNSNAFILVPSICSWLIGSLYRKIFTPLQKTYIPAFNLVVCSMIILVSALIMTKAIYLTNYPLVILFKSCNILSVLTIAVLCSRVKDNSQKLARHKIIVGLIITVGILVYHFGSSEQRLNFQGSALGFALLAISVVMDGFLPDFQAEIKTKFKPSAMQMFQQTNKWKTILSLIYAICSLQMKQLLQFYLNHPTCLLHMLALGVTGALGQIIVFWMIANFKQHVVPFIITTRKLLTVIISIVLYNHQSNFTQISGIILVFTVVCFDFYEQIKTPDKILPEQRQGNSLLGEEEESTKIMSQINDQGIRQQIQK